MPKLKRKPEYLEIEIELKPYLIKYATCGNDGNHIYLRPNGPSATLWEFLVPKLGVPPRGWRPKNIRPEKCLALRVPYWYITEAGLGMWISEARKRCIAQLIELAFWRDLYETVMDARIHGGEIELYEIRRFREMYGITEFDFLEGSMEKRYRRMKKKRRPQPKSRVNALMCA